MGFFGIGTEKKTDVEEEKHKEEEQEDNDEEETEEGEGTKEFVEGVKGLTERQLLKLLVLMNYENDYKSISDNWYDLIKIVKEDE